MEVEREEEEEKSIDLSCRETLVENPQCMEAQNKPPAEAALTAVTNDNPSVVVAEPQDDFAVPQFDALYEPHTPIGKGTYGKVYCYKRKTARATTQSIECVAVKLINLNRVTGEDAPSIVHDYQLQEAVGSMSFPHPHLLQAYDVHLVPRSVRIIYPLAQSSLKNWQFHPTRLPAYIRIFYHMTSALEHLHRQGLVHRDLKPDNILLFGLGDNPDTSLGEAVHAQLGDWSIVRPYWVTRYGVPLGNEEAFTRWYRPIELLLGVTLYDDRADVWALGVTMVHSMLNSPMEFFGQATEAEMIDNIFQILGVPDESMWPGVTTLPKFESSIGGRNANKSWRRQRSSDVSDIFRKRLSAVMGAHGIDLLLGMLTLPPHKRISAGTASRHRYFKRVARRASASTAAAPLTTAVTSNSAAPATSSISAVAAVAAVVAVTPPLDDPWKWSPRTTTIVQAGQDVVVSVPSPISVSLLLDIFKLSFDKYAKIAWLPTPEAKATATAIAMSFVAELWAAYTLTRPTPTEEHARMLLRVLLNTAWDWVIDFRRPTQLLTKEIPEFAKMQRRVLELFACDLVHFPTLHTAIFAKVPHPASPGYNPTFLHVMIVLATYGRFVPTAWFVSIESTAQLCVEVAQAAAESHRDYIAMRNDRFSTSSASNSSSSSSSSSAFSSSSARYTTVADALRDRPRPWLQSSEGVALCTLWRRALLLFRQHAPDMLGNLDRTSQHFVSKLLRAPCLKPFTPPSAQSRQQHILVMKKYAAI